MSVYLNLAVFGTISGLLYLQVKEAGVYNRFCDIERDLEKSSIDSLLDYEEEVLAVPKILFLNQDNKEKKSELIKKLENAQKKVVYGNLVNCLSEIAYSKINLNR